MLFEMTSLRKGTILLVSASQKLKALVTELTLNRFGKKKSSDDVERSSKECK